MFLYQTFLLYFLLVAIAYQLSHKINAGPSWLKNG